MALRQDEIVVSYRVEGSSSIDGARASFDKLTQAEKDAIEQAKKLGKETGKATKEIKTNVDQSTQSMNNFSGALKKGTIALAAAFSIKQVIDFGKELLLLNAKMEQYQKRINFAAGSAQEGAKVTQYLTGITRKFGLDLETVIQTYSSFAAASKASNLSQQDTIKIFEGVTKAVAAFGLSAEQSQGAFLAITQMISKGTVSAEELRGQLGERLPGSFAIAARSIGVTEKALGKMLEQGQVISKDFLPKFAAELEKTFGDEAAKNIDTITGKLNLLATNWTELLKILGKNSQPIFDFVLEYANKTLDGIFGVVADINQVVEREAFKAAEPIIKNIQNLSTKFEENSERLAFLNEMLAEYQSNMEAATNIVKNNAVEGADELNKSLGIQFETYKKVTDAIESMIKATFKVDPEKQAIDMKKLTSEYKALIAELERQEAIQIRLQKLSLPLDATAQQTMQNEVEVLEIKAKFGEAKLAIDKRFYALNVVEAGKNSEARVLDVKEANKAILLELQKFYTDEFNEAKTSYDNLLDEQKDYEQKRTQQQQESLNNREKLQRDLAAIDEKYEKEKKERDKKNKDDDIKEAAETNQRIADENMLYLQESLQLAQTVFNGFMNLRQQALAAELSANQRLFEEQLSMFEGNQELQAQARDRFQVKEREIRQKQFRAEQQAAMANAIFTAAPQIVKYIATAPPLAALVGATLVAQLGFIAAQKMPEFARGTEYVEGPGTGTSDSIVARLSKGERVMTAKQNKPLLDLGIKNDDIPKIVLDYMSLTSGRTKGSNSRGIERKLDDLNRSIKSLPVAAISLDGKGFSKSIRSGNRTSVILNNQFVN